MPRIERICCLVLAASMGGFTAGARAQPAAASAAQEFGRQPLWEIGALGLAVSQPAYPGASARVNRGLALPYLMYRGQFLRADSGGAGVRAIKTPRYELDVGFSGAFGSNSNDIEARSGMPNLGTLAEFGPRLKWPLGAGPFHGQWRAEIPLRTVFDLSNQLAHQGMAFEPELVFERRAINAWNYNVVAGLVWGDRHLADTFYGVAPRFATEVRPAYAARGGLIATRLSVGLWRDLTRDLRMFGLARVESVNGAANQRSPLVRQQTSSLLLVGLTYTWKRSDRPGSD